MIPIDDLANRFRFHKADDVKAFKHNVVRTLMLDVADYVNKTCPPGREASLAITKLEEAMFWANAAIARQKEN